MPSWLWCFNTKDARDDEADTDNTAEDGYHRAARKVAVARHQAPLSGQRWVARSENEKHLFPHEGDELTLQEQTIVRKY